MKKIIIASLAVLTLSGCAKQTGNVTDVNCVGRLFISTTDRVQDYRLKKYNSYTNKYFMIANRTSPYPTWIDADYFNSIRCEGDQ